VVDTVLVHVAICKAHHGTKAKRLPPVSGCGHLRLPFAMPLFFAAPPANTSPTAAAAPAPAANAAARSSASSAAAAAPAAAVSAGAEAIGSPVGAASRAVSQQTAQLPAVSAAATGGNARGRNPGAARGLRKPEPQQHFAAGPSTGDLAPLDAPPQQSAASLNGRNPARHKPHASAVAADGSSTAGTVAPAHGQAVPRMQAQMLVAARLQPRAKPAAAATAIEVVGSRAAASMAAPVVLAATGMPADKAAAAATSKAGKPTPTAAVQMAAAAPALDLDGAAQAAGAAAGCPVEAQQAAWQPPGVGRSSGVAAATAGFGLEAVAEGSGAGQQLSSVSAPRLSDPTAVQVQQPADAVTQVHVGERKAADVVSTAAEAVQDPANPEFAFGSDFVELPESPVAR
jgi:trimeric autotransporter adhesin